MKNRIFAAAATAAIAGLALTGCTGADKTPVAETTAPSTTPSASPSASPTVDPFKSQQDRITELMEPTKILGQETAKSMATVQIGDLPAKYESVSFIVDCLETSKWELKYDGGKAFASGDCGPDAIATSIVSVEVKDLKSETVSAVLDGKTEVYLTAFATLSEDS